MSIWRKILSGANTAAQIASRLRIGGGKTPLIIGTVDDLIPDDIGQKDEREPEPSAIDTLQKREPAPARSPKDEQPPRR